MFFVRKCCWLLLLLTLVACGGVMDDLNPSGSDNRTAAQPGTTGPAVGQNAPDFTLTDTLGNSVTLSSVFPTVQGVVIYFTMWCPICDTHMSHMQSSQIPSFPNVRFYAVDYVSATVADARNAEISNGFDGSGFMVLADTHQTVLGLYQATMGTTIVIDRTGVVRMNEDYKDGSRLQTVLSSLP
ncbi:MAG TPA: redoxin domain-containing protein [Nitrospirota bacterium]|nr:redoxin domain-containing protein [Nitrospirota bacterium]